MKTARWWPAAVLLLGLAVLGTIARPNKEGFRSPPYRPVVRFRHKVSIAIFSFLLATREHCSYSKYGTNYNGTLPSSGDSPVVVIQLPAETYLVNRYPSVGNVFSKTASD